MYTRLKWLVMVVAFAVGALSAAPSAAAEMKLGIVLMHGKSGVPDNRSQTELAAQLRAAGMLTRAPDMPWSRSRYIDGGVEKAVAEIAAHVAALRSEGAQSVFLFGQSMGAAVAVSYAALKGDVDGLILSAPGHVPTGYQRMDFMREALDRAKQMVAEGKGNEIATFADSDQGQRLSPRMKAADYVSWFDPAGSAEMSVMAAKVRPGIAVLMVVGNQDRIVATAKSMILDRIPADPRHRYVEIQADHRRTPAVGTPHFIDWLKARAQDP